MSEYFEAWKNSRFVAGEDASEASFVIKCPRRLAAARRVDAQASS
jgi:hypothetical protein